MAMESDRLTEGSTLVHCPFSTAQDPILEVRGLAKYFGRLSVLRGLNLKVNAGEFIALFGRNGAGKTTFLRIIAGLSRASAGSYEIRIPGSEKPRYVRGAIGYLSHNTALYQDLTALENLQFYAQLMGLRLPGSELVRRIKAVGLSGREKDPVRNYSRGMQQRLGIARAFLHDPTILLLDEPFTGLDQAGSSFLKSYLQQAHSSGKTCIMALHDAAMGYELADRLIVIEKGTALLDIAKSSLSLEEFERKFKAATG
jgi:heme exporter protein A